MVIRTFLDFTGSFIMKWHIRSTLDSSQLNDNNAIIVEPEDTNSSIDARSFASTVVTSKNS